MLSQVGCPEEDAEVDPELGYPAVYAKLCRHADAAGLPMPFTEGPPQRFLPYAPHAEDVSLLVCILSVLVRSNEVAIAME